MGDDPDRSQWGGDGNSVGGPDPSSADGDPTGGTDRSRDDPEATDRRSRRALLGAIGAVGVGSLGGCLGLEAPTAGAGERSPPAADGTASAANGSTDDETITLAETGLPPTICEEPISEDPGIYAVLDPVFDDDWAGYDVPDLYRGGLTDDSVVVGVERGREARAYPLSILWWHEIVNDVVGETELMVTFCPLCKSGVVASRVVDGRASEFLVSGLLWQPERIQVAAAEEGGTTFGADREDPDAGVRQNGNLVAYDRATGSYWSQIMATAICGPHEGTRLTVLPSTVTTWGEWRRDRSAPSVLVPPPVSGVEDPDQRDVQ